jgi:CRP-like cAMP-binding protein
MYKNPFKGNENTAIDFALTQNSSNILECYSGWLREDIRSILRIHPSKRRDRDIDILMNYFSTMKSFKKYNAQSRREFLTRGEYNSWQKGRHVIKQGYPALALYFILDGEVAVSKNLEKKSDELSASNENHDEAVAHRYKCWDGNNMIRLTTLFSGDSFGEVAFTLSKDQQTRQATVTTLKNTEFLLVEVIQS